MPNISLNLYTFSKKDNSTVLPTGTGTVFNGEFKTGFNILAFDVKLYGISGVPDYNYAYISKFNRYYFINNWSYLDGFWHAALSVDVLASWKSEIGTQSLYVTRSASDSDGSIIDGAYPTTAECTIAWNTDSGEPFGASSGCFIVGIVGGANSVGAISYYAMSGGTFSSLISEMLGDYQWLNIDIDEMSEEIQKAFINPSQYIASALWIPVDAGSVPGTGVGAIPVGWWSFPAGGTRIDPMAAKVSGSYSLTIPKHPLSGTRGKYLNLAPYSDYTLTFFPFGTFSLDPIRLQDESTLDLRFVLDCCTGEAVLYVTVGGAPIKVVNGRYGVPVPTGQIAFNVTSFSGAATAAGVAAAAGAGTHGKEFLSVAKNMIKAAKTGTSYDFRTDLFQGASSDIVSSAVAALANVDYHGQMGSNIYGVVPVGICGRFYDLVAEDLSHKGRPLCQTVTLNTLSGYMQCADPDVEIGCTGTERDMIIRHLIGGFYYE